MDRDTLLGLSKDDLIALVLAQAAQIEALTRRVADLETRLGQPPKTPDNSSLPPSRGAKPNLPPPGDRPPRKGRPGSFRALHPEPDRVVEALACTCPHCAQALTAADQTGLHAYDHIDLPPARPIVTRVHRHRGTCPGCRRDFCAPPPDGLAPGSPFGPGLCALVLQCKRCSEALADFQVAAEAQCHGMSSSMRACGHPLTSLVSRSVK